MTLENNDRTTMINLYMEKALDSVKDSEFEGNSPTTRLNRAYYSAFYCATALLLTKNIARDSHKGVLSEFGKEFMKTGEFPKNLGAYLRDLEKGRYSADYDVNTPITREDAVVSSQKARIFYEATVKELQSQL